MSCYIFLPHIHDLLLSMFSNVSFHINIVYLMDPTLPKELKKIIRDACWFSIDKEDKIVDKYDRKDGMLVINESQKRCFYIIFWQNLFWECPIDHNSDSFFPEELIDLLLALNIQTIDDLTHFYPYLSGIVLNSIKYKLAKRESKTVRLLETKDHYFLIE